MNKMKQGILFLIVGIAVSLVPHAAWANHLLIENFEVAAIDTASNTISFTADVSWENSWRTTTNYDAVWVFVKYSTDAGVTWKHASMAGNGVDPMGFDAPTGFEMVVPSDEKGFFLQRTDLSSGDVDAENLEFVWDYAQDGLSDAQATAANTINKIFGVEMVYIPEGAFYAGDGNSSSDYRFKQGSADNDPWYITSENAISTTTAAADGYYYQSSSASGESSTGSVFLIPTSFPKGYDDFYMMKYELTEGQWVSFFNTLTTTQKTKRDLTSSTDGGKNADSVVARNTLSWDATTPAKNATTLRADRPVSFISWMDLAAYADWAGLRPMTELEYEKACRGKDVGALVNEYAWGSTSYNEALATEIYPDADEDGTEQIFDGSANINRNNLAWTTGDGRAGGIAESQIGPLRAGIFAENSTTRATSGAGFYGAMELSGNLNEMVVTLGRSEGRRFLASHGDGQLSTVSGYQGNATNTDWPGIDATDSARGITGTVGSGYRGGDFASNSSKYFYVSNRTNAATDPDTLGYNARYDASFGIYAGGRLGRSAP